MFLARVIGKVWSTMKNETLEGHRLLLIQPVTPELKETGKRMVVADCVGAGAGELVYCCRGRESSFPFLPKEVPTDTTIVAIIDELHVNRAARREETSPC
ncbi:MAG: EutN/CcmL family microcompartment protein [Acidobacteria bacterium]|nr:EutN/CcmL family microcompartment protein [Acidobacteriota bacterium]